jgi:hypothetical protein
MTSAVLLQVNQALCSLALAMGGIGVANVIGRDWGLSPTLLAILPYGATIASMLLPGLIGRTSQRSGAPAALGQPFFRERRS